MDVTEAIVVDAVSEARDVEPPRSELAPSLEPSRERTPGLRSHAFLVHLCVLFVALPLLTLYARGQWFSGDEWDFILNRGFIHPALGLFVPHNEHWSTVPIVVWRLVAALFGLREYWPYLACTVLAHLVAVHLLWRIITRAGVSPWVATAVTASVIPLGVGWENLLSGFQFGFVASVTFGLAAILNIDGSQPGWKLDRRIWGVWSCATLSLASSGIGVTMLFGLGLTALLRRGFRSAVVASAVPTIVYVLWYLKFGHEAVHNDTARLSISNVTELPGYVGTGITTALGQWSSLPQSGGALAVALLAVMAYSTRRGSSDVILALAMTGVVLFIVVGYGRVGLGVDEAGSSRYAYIFIMLIVPAVAVALNFGSRSRGMLIPCAVCALLGLNGVAGLTAADRAKRATDIASKPLVLASAALVISGQTLLNGMADPVADPGATGTAVASLGAAELPDLTSATPTQFLSTRLTTQLGTSPTQVLSDETMRLSRVNNLKTVKDKTGCFNLLQVLPSSRLGFANGGSIGSFSLTLTAPSMLQVSMTDNATGLVAGPRQLSLPAGTTWVRDSATNTTLNFGPSGAVARACGAMSASR